MRPGVGAFSSSHTASSPVQSQADASEASVLCSPHCPPQRWNSGDGGGLADGGLTHLRPTSHILPWRTPHGLRRANPTQPYIPLAAAASTGRPPGWLGTGPETGCEKIEQRLRYSRDLGGRSSALFEGLFLRHQLSLWGSAWP